MPGILAVAAIISLVSAPVSAQQPAPPDAPAEQPAPSGWVGITYSEKWELDSDGNLVYSGYPVVMTVYPGSPAAAAGVAAGDTIIAFNDLDVRRYAAPSQLMIQPGKILLIRYRRAGRDHVAKITVAERSRDRESTVAVTMKPFFPETPEPPFVLTPPPVRSMRVALSRSSLVPIAGAEFRALSLDLAKSLGLKPQGLFVINVLEGSPAKEAGLRDGDVVVRAAERQLVSPEDLRDLMRLDINKTLKLEILRQKKTRTLMLRW